MTRINLVPPNYLGAAVNVTLATNKGADGVRHKNLPQIELCTRRAIATGYAVATYMNLWPEYSADNTTPRNLAARAIDAAMAVAFATQELDGSQLHVQQARQKVVQARRAGSWDSFMNLEIAAKPAAKRGAARVLRNVVPDLSTVAMALGRAQSLMRRSAENSAPVTPPVSRLPVAAVPEVSQPALL